MDLAKYETLISDLSALESQVEILKNKYSDTLQRNKELEVSLNDSQQDKNLLHEKISELESELDQVKLKVEEKSKLNLESRVDKHLSADFSG